MNNKYVAYVGTYTSGKSQGIYIYEMDLANGGLKYLGTSDKIENPSYQVIDNKVEFLYTVMETEKY